MPWQICLAWLHLEGFVYLAEKRLRSSQIVKAEMLVHGLETVQNGSPWFLSLCLIVKRYNWNYIYPEHNWSAVSELNIRVARIMPFYVTCHTQTTPFLGSRPMSADFGRSQSIIRRTISRNLFNIIRLSACSAAIGLTSAMLVGDS